MSAKSQAVFKAALELSEAERTKLVKRLLGSLSHDEEEMDDADLAAELDRRLAEFQRDPSVGIPWSKVKRRP